MKIAVIENEFGEENIDTDILRTESKEQILQMSNGCICCTIREDLRETLQLLAAKRRKGLVDFERIVIETTGLADPGPVVQTFFMDDEIAETYLVAFHPHRGRCQARQRSSWTTARKRAARWALPTRSSLCKTDLVSDAEKDALDPPPQAHEPACAHQGRALWRSGSEPGA